jgi:hypothetical protein
MADVLHPDAQPWPDREGVDMERDFETRSHRHGMGPVSVIAGGLAGSYQDVEA